MRPADARFSASTITRISIRLSLVGEHVDCRTNTSRPATFSSSSTMTSPSENRPTMQRPRLKLRCLTTASASFGFALPVNTRIRSNAIVEPRIRNAAATGGRKGLHPPAAWNGWGGRDRTYECRNQNPVPYHLATPQGNRRFHPSGGGETMQRVTIERSRHETGAVFRSLRPRQRLSRGLLAGARRHTPASRSGHRHLNVTRCLARERRETG